MTINIENISERFTRIRNRYSQRDSRMAQVRAIRMGKMSEVAPDVFPETGPWQEPIVANIIDVAARDMAEMIAPLPTFTAGSMTMTSDRARESASLKTKVALGYVTNSDLQVQMYTAADWYVTYGFLPIRVEADYEGMMPVIRTLDPVGCYPEIDRFGRVVSMFQRVLINKDVLAAQFPEYANKLSKDKNMGLFGGNDIEVVFYHDKDWDMAFIPSAAGGYGNTSTVGMILEKTPNPIGKCMIRIAQRPGVTDIPRGQFDDVIFVQMAKARLALLSLQAAHESVNAPLVVPMDVPEVPIGPGATIRTNNPAGVGRVPLEIPAAAFQEQAQLDRELQLGSRFPEMRTGQTNASIVTGKGVQALLGGYESQITAHQAIFARTLQEVMSLCFEVDCHLFGEIKKNLRGSMNGTPFDIEYTPMKAINNDYSIDVRYGLMAGLDPNRWLIFALQARAEKMFSRDFMRRELPVDINVEDEARKIDIEDLEEAAKQALMGYAQSIPALAAQGQDVSGPINAISKVIADRRKGKSLADSVAEAFTPEPVEPPQPEQPSPEEMMAMGGPAEMGMGGSEESLPEGLSPQGTMQGVAPGQQGMAPGGKPDLMTLLAGLGASGRPNLGASVQRRVAI
ncbi:MAG: hypothetical protein EBT07_04840 [Actinobacteria bacterium]|nr:hypothetical protein [Actinomycetota bacterium]